MKKAKLFEQFNGRSGNYFITLRGWWTRNINIYMHAHVRCLVLSCLVSSSPNGVVRAIRAFIILLLLQLEDNICVTGFCFAFFFIVHLSAMHTHLSNGFIWIFIIREIFFYLLLPFIHLSSCTARFILDSRISVCAVCVQWIRNQVIISIFYEYVFVSLLSSNFWLIDKSFVFWDENATTHRLSPPSSPSLLLRVIIVVGDTARNKRHSMLINKNANFRES